MKMSNGKCLGGHMSWGQTSGRKMSGGGGGGQMSGGQMSGYRAACLIYFAQNDSDGIVFMYLLCLCKLYIICYFN